MLDGKRLVVTGGSGGLGGAIARRCAAAGARVAVGHLDGRADGALPLRFDVRDAAAIEAAVARVVAEFGGIDGWVNAAGVHHAELLVAAQEERIRAQLEVNLLGTILCSRAVLPQMLKQRGGVILNVSSVAAQDPIRGGAVYAATKGGVESFTRAVAQEYGRKGIRAVCIRPGPVDTAMLAASKALAGDEVAARTALQRVATADEVAALAVFLLGDEASFITGSVHGVDGGWT